jgi:hypothetical protein
MSNASSIPFTPTGDTILVPAAASAPTGVQAASASGVGQYRIVNTGTIVVHLGVGATAAQATANAVAATAGVPAKGIIVMPGAIEILRFANDAFFSGVSASAVNVYITPGQGI